jgi:hypothetical protein
VGVMLEIPGPSLLTTIQNTAVVWIPFSHIT